jgi:hypothetical protein
VTLGLLTFTAGSRGPSEEAVGSEGAGSKEQGRREKLGTEQSRGHAYIYGSDMREASHPDLLQPENPRLPVRRQAGSRISRLSPCSGSHEIIGEQLDMRKCMLDHGAARGILLLAYVGAHMSLL